MEKILLDGKWNLTVAENADIKKSKFSPKKISDFKDCDYTCIAGSVPGNFELDMVSAGLLEDPYYSTNVLKLQELENRHLWYYREFDCDFEDSENCYLQFEGIDTIAEIYLNGEIIGNADNMFIAHEFELYNLKKGKNEVVVHILPAAIEARKFESYVAEHAQRYNFDSLNIRKAAHSYGWDIMPRILSAGIWKSVYLIKKKPEYIKDCYFVTADIQPQQNRALIRFLYSVHSDFDSLKGLKITADAVCRDSEFHFETDVWHTNGYAAAWQENLYFWWPRHYGNPDRYDIEIKLWRDGKVIDTKNIKFGVRTVKLERTSTTKYLGDGKFQFYINNKPVFVLGSNWVPLDAFHSNDINRVDKAIDMLWDCGCNAIRLWGGNVYESEHFYELCDQKGIMLWQDFAMACGIYPHSEHFKETLRKEATAVVKRLRNYACVILWAGDNECDQVYCGLGRNPNKNVLTREILSEVVAQHDTVRPYLPSSPYMDEECIKTGLPTPEDHPWGPRDYFKGDYYKNVKCSFASEMGYHGCPSPESLKKFIAPDKLWPIMKTQKTANDDWHIHAANMEIKENTCYEYRIPLMNKQIDYVFKETPEKLNDFAKMSQIVQAEAKKYFIEKFRIAKGKTSGIIWWNLLDGWPQISDAVVDYYFTPKLAYHYINRSQEPVCLMFDEPQDGLLKLYAVNELAEEKQFSYKVTDVTNGTVLCEGVSTALPTTSVCITSLTVPEKPSFYLIEWTMDNEKYTNHYMTQTRDISYCEYLKAISECGYDEFVGFDD